MCLPVASGTIAINMCASIRPYISIDRKSIIDVQTKMNQGKGQEEAAQLTVGCRIIFTFLDLRMTASGTCSKGSVKFFLIIMRNLGPKVADTYQRLSKRLSLCLENEGM